MNDETREIQNRLADLLEDFAGADVSTYDDEGRSGHGMVLRIMVAGRAVEVDVSVNDVTDAI